MQERTYTIKVQGTRYLVSKTVYEAYHQHREHERYLSNQAADQERSLERFAEEGVNVEYQYAKSRPSMEDEIVHKQQLHRLRQCLGELEVDERYIIHALFFQKRSERNLAAELHIPQRTLHDRKQRILCKMLKIMESQK